MDFAEDGMFLSPTTRWTDATSRTLSGILDAGNLLFNVDLMDVVLMVVVKKG